jgi:hypothetical protein
LTGVNALSPAAGNNRAGITLRRKFMAAQEIDRSRWAPFFDALTKTLIGKQAEVEVDSLDLGQQIEAEWTPLIGIAYDQEDDLVEVALEDLDHLIRAPKRVFVDAIGGDLVSIEVVDGSGNAQILKLKDLLTLPPPQHASAGAQQ